MTKLHFEDLTKITCPFGMLDDDTQKRLKACDDVESFNGTTGTWVKPAWWEPSATYRAKPKPRRLVTWVHWDEDDAVCCETRKEANQCLNNYGGYTYRIERDEDGRNPTIELVETSSVAADNEVKGGNDD